MSQFDTLSHLTRPTIEKLPEFKQQPPTNDTRYVVRCKSTLCVEGKGPDVVAETWFKSPPLHGQTIRMIRGVKLYAESHDQGYVSDLTEGNWTWLQLAIFACETDTTPKKDSQGQELVMTSHSNKVNSRNFEWMEGSAVNMRRIFLKALEPGNVIAVRLCARFRGWKIFATNGHLVIDIGEDNQAYPITPIKIDTNLPVPVRRNVKTWYDESKTNHKTGVEVSLFIRALGLFQKLPPENQLSYYRIAAIHGYPYNVPWNLNKPVIPLDEPSLDQQQKDGDGGWYCQHNNDLFPTWHRVYMMLYEKRIQEIMMGEADELDDGKGEWTAAAMRWRLPYWDWAVDTDLPEIACTKKIRVIKSWDGRGQPQMEEVDNPMYRFQMPGNKPMGDSSYGNYRINNKEDMPWEQCIGTSRHGISLRDAERKWVQGETNVFEVNKALQEKRLQNRTLRDSVYRLLTEEYSTKYVRFASTKYDRVENQAAGEKAREYLSLEQIHNAIHGAVGGEDDRTGAGHMSSVAVAAFDPAFWLHHCNIDRLLHLWQSSNPGNWFRQHPGQKPVEQPRPDHDTIKEQRPAPADLSPQDPLRPFHVSMDQDDFYNSNQVRNVEALNYTYDYVDEITDEFGDVIPAKSNAYINRRYGPEKEAFKTLKPQYDPVINVIYDRYAFNGRAYSFLFFLGNLDKTVPYKRQTSLIGSIFTFSTTMEGSDVTCRSCYVQQKAHVLSRAQIPLTAVVPSDDRPSRLECRDFLEKNLRWTAVYENGRAVERDGLKDVKITLSIGVNELVKIPAPEILETGKKALDPLKTLVEPLVKLPESIFHSRFSFSGYKDLDFNWEKAYFQF
ncbi:Di-copper centre-containing [Cordyceps fumosorosea ARSEF 2679]|uniref:tyrosinase n=1 Tax=Cordyceps fumosorosea (strain ARSEF 2679) TaxID=1081104 RepID=A0A167LIV8_CORFA|nr:Di-copper centre-containing [Cordyceps fumosorosea ARSEF 2679]OAA53139.1 Di-copper centre-containing [Cordyceps fumosorosea ARSEF 2679]